MPLRYETGGFFPLHFLCCWSFDFTWTPHCDLSQGYYIMHSFWGKLQTVPEYLGKLGKACCRTYTARVWALAEVRGTCSGGSKSQVTTGRHSERVKPSRPMQTHVQVLNKCPTAHVISRILNVVNVCQTLLGDGKVFPRHQFARHTTSFSTIPGTIQSPRPPKDSLLSRTIVRGKMWPLDGWAFTCDHQLYEYNNVQSK